MCYSHTKPLGFTIPDTQFWTNRDSPMKDRYAGLLDVNCSSGLEPHETADDKSIGITDIEEDWFASATTNLGLDFFDLTHTPGVVPILGAVDPAYTGFSNPNTSDEP